MKKRFLLRLDPELFRVLERWASDELRSVNGQIEYLLREAARRAGRLPSGPQAPPILLRTQKEAELLLRERGSFRWTIERRYRYGSPCAHARR